MVHLKVPFSFNLGSQRQFTSDSVLEIYWCLAHILPHYTIFCISTSSLLGNLPQYNGRQIDWASIEKKWMAFRGNEGQEVEDSLSGSS